MASIDFDDFEPALLPSAFHAASPGQVRPLVKNELFEVALRELPAGQSYMPQPGRMEIVASLEGTVEIRSSEPPIELSRPAIST